MTLSLSMTMLPTGWLRPSGSSLILSCFKQNCAMYRSGVLIGSKSNQNETINEALLVVSEILMKPKRSKIDSIGLYRTILAWGRLFFVPQAKHLGPGLAKLRNCRYCKKEVLATELFRHIKDHHDTRHTCDVCNLAFVSETRLILHKVSDVTDS